MSKAVHGRQYRAWPLRALFTFIVLLAGLTTIQAQPRFTQQGSKLVGSGAVGIAEQGYSVALSANGSTAVIGGWRDNSTAGNLAVGAMWVFTRRGKVWAQQGNKLVGSGAVGSANQGTSVALSADGNTAIVGGPEDSTGDGATWLFSRKVGLWTQQAKLVGSGAVGSANQGRSVALSADGNTAIVGGDRDNVFAGATWVFVRRKGSWVQQAKLVGSGSVGNAHQGHSVALSADGNTAIIGGFGDDSGAGAAWVFTRSGETWTQHAKLIGSGAVCGGPECPNQGRSVALSADGNTAIVGGPFDNNFVGAAWVFTRKAGAWTQQGSKLVGSGGVGRSHQGYSVALSAGGNIAVLGGIGDNSNAGAAWIFTRMGGMWIQYGSKLVGSGAANSPFPAQQGFSVALSASGNTAIVGGHEDNSLLGASWVFVRAGDYRHPQE